MNPTELLHRLRQTITDEADHQNLTLARQWAKPLQERVALGRAIEGLRVEKIYPDGIVLLTCDRNESRFREGDILVLHRGVPGGEDSLDCLLEWDEETQIEVLITGGNLALLHNYPTHWVADEGRLDLSHFYLDTLDQLADSARGRDRILPMLQDNIHPQIDFARYERGWEYAFHASLNDSQAEALALAYATDLYHLIQGPPGTGKTLVLAHLVRLLVEDGLRVFVSALTHRAIGNLLNKIARLDPDLPACKIGTGLRARDLEVENFDNFFASGFHELTGGYVIGATPFATRTRRLANVEFDVVIFDEASQITLPLAVMGMLTATKYIFCGDDRQLPPVTTLRKNTLARTSIFTYLGNRGNETLLATTYRMNDILTQWPSESYYAGLLQPSLEAATRRLVLSQRTSAWDFALAPEHPAVFLDLLHYNATTKSHLEAETVCELLRALINAGISPAEVGIVTPFRAQGRLLRNLLRRLWPEETFWKEIVVDTVERMQGQEREVVLVSLASSNVGFLSGLADFFFEPERLNVTITRPRTKLILVGSSHLLKLEVEDPEVSLWLEQFGAFMQSCQRFAIPQGRLRAS